MRVYLSSMGVQHHLENSFCIFLFPTTDWYRFLSMNSRISGLHGFLTDFTSDSNKSPLLVARTTDKTSEIIPRGICVGNPSYSSQIMVGKLLQWTTSPKSMRAKKSLRNGFWIVEHGWMFLRNRHFFLLEKSRCLQPRPWFYMNCWSKFTLVGLGDIWVIFCCQLYRDYNKPL